MSSNTKRMQQRFEGLFGGNTTDQWKTAKPSIITSMQLSKSDATLLLSDLKLDSKDLYFKGLLSLCEALNSIQNNLYSWATVKLYYSVFYFLSCSLACNNIAVVRRMRELYYVKAKEGEYFNKSKDNTDHRGTIFLFQDMFGNSDKLQTNAIETINSYEWLMKKREEVNYKDREFHEPNPIYFWSEVARHVNNDKFNHLLETYIKDEYLYCFQEDHACLALPIKRMLLTKKNLIDEYQLPLLESDKENKIKAILSFSGTNSFIIQELVG